MTDLVRPVPHALDALRSDHRRASQLMKLLTDRIEGLRELSGMDIEIALGVFRYMVDFVDNQHHAREDRLLDLVARREPEIAKRVRRADEEHGTITREGSEILALLQNLKERAWVANKTLVARLHHYADTLAHHFYYEEAKLFDFAEAVLSAADWRKFERMEQNSADPLFGADLESDYQALFDVYINQVREIGTPATRHVVHSAAALVDSAMALAGGTRSCLTTMRGGMIDLIKLNLDCASSLTSSRSVREFCEKSLDWSKASFDQSNALSRRLFDTSLGTARSTLAPFADALGSAQRTFDVSHNSDKTGSSWQAHLVNLMLRATVKRMASSAGEDFAVPVKNVEIPRTAIEQFIPDLASDVEVEMIELENAFAERLSIRRSKTRCTILFIPGGGFMMAPTQAHRLMAARLARAAHAEVVLVNYRLAPEYRFPAGLIDCFEAYNLLLAEGRSADSIFLVGDSAGGGLALSTMLKLRDEGVPLPAAAVLLSPVTDLSYSGVSRRENNWTDPSLPNDENNLIAQVYLGDVAKDDPLASPLFADLSGLPPILIQVGSIEILLDDALRVAAKIRALGGDCECEVWHDMPHDWVLFGMLPEARKAMRRIGQFISKRLTWPSPSIQCEVSA